MDKDQDILDEYDNTYRKVELVDTSCEDYLDPCRITVREYSLTELGELI